jgi:hypothetical protein
MNIFFLDADPEIAAELQADVHVVKMILETMQLLCTAMRCSMSVHVWNFDLYQATHINHPCAKWVRADKAHFEWALRHGLALCREYSARYGGKRHKCEDMYDAINNAVRPEFAALSIDAFAGSKLAHSNVPIGINFVAVAINDDVFPAVAQYADDGRLDAVETYCSYYDHKQVTLKRPMRWRKQELAPAKLIDKTRARLGRC